MSELRERVIAWLHGHKGIAGTLMSLGYAVLYVSHGGDPAYDGVRELFVWLSGALVGGGYLTTDDAARLSAARANAGCPERRVP